MGFTSFLGRVLFVSVFVISAWQEFNEFGVDGGPAAKYIAPKYKEATKYFSTQTGLALPDVDIKYLVAGAIVLKGLGSLLFIFGSVFGATLLLLHQLAYTPILYNFYYYDMDSKEYGQLFAKFTQNLALFGGLLFFIGMKNSMPRRSNKKKAIKAKTN